MVKKPKSTSCSSGWCSNHLLEMQPSKHAECYYRKKTKLRLCPRYNKLRGWFHRSIPIVNEDRKHYTPCFILEEEKTYYIQNDDQLINTHKHKLQSVDTCTIMVAKHGRKQSYCSVCRVDYQDYLIVSIHLYKHIEEISHRSQLRSNKFTKYILQWQQQIRRSQIGEIKAIEETNEVERIRRMQQNAIKE